MKTAPDTEKNHTNCTLCPRKCGVDRASGKLGYCRTGTGFSVSTVCSHKGEEPVLSGGKGICNIFFTHCNMQCVYCQNFQISRNTTEHEYISLDAVIEKIEMILRQGIRHIGFVSPSHVIPQMKGIIKELKSRRDDLVFVMNTNAYDRKEIIGSLKGLIDVYLPDLKYLDPGLSLRFSECADYPEIAVQAVKEMFRQKGTRLDLGKDGLASSGLIIRHLVLPGQAEQSKRVLRFIAAELSQSVHLSLMAQYFPTPYVKDHPQLGRILSEEEYNEVLEEMERLGFHSGWVQELDSHQSFRPDFESEDVFET
jgi:putative pyruvate formate lyase activating enzyme